MPRHSYTPKCPHRGCKLRVKVVKGVREDNAFYDWYIVSLFLAVVLNKSNLKD